MYKHLECGCERNRSDAFYMDGGYEWADHMDRIKGSSAIGSWGQDGWDAGKWPYVIFATLADQDTPSWGWAMYVEGDIYEHYFDHEECRNSSLDQQIAWYWCSETHEAGDAAREFKARDDNEGLGVTPLPDRFRGPFSWSRVKL